MGGGGSSAPNVTEKGKAQKLLEKKAMLASDPRVSQLLADYGTGKISMQDAMAKGQSLFAAPNKDQWMQQQLAGGVGLDARKSIQDFYNTDIGKKYKTGDKFNLKDPKNVNTGYYTQGDVDSVYNQWADAESKKNQGKNLEWLWNTEREADPFEGGMAQLMDLATTNPLAAQRYMTDEIRNNPLTKGLFGEGGLQERLGGEEQEYSKRALANSDAYNAFMSEMKGGLAGHQDKYNALYGEISDPRSIQLTADDNTMLGNQYGDITRQYGQMENELSQNLASRGLSAAPSGASGAMFSGLLGNKNEQLRKAQSDVIANRFNQAMQTNQMRLNLLGQQGGELLSGYNTRGNAMNSKSLNDMNALNSARGNLTNLGALQGNLKNSMFNQNMQGREANENALRNAAGLDMQYNQALQNQMNQAFSQQQATAGPSFGDIATGVLGAGAGYFTGGLGGAAGSALGQSLFGNKTLTDQSAKKG